jgi:4-hydroxy-2-oxoheptanedioate aldolase
MALHDKPAIVRVQIGDYSTASRMLDFGAAAVVAPMVNDVAEARRFVSFTKLPPLGDRSWGPARVQRLTGQDANQYLHEANDMQLSIAMIETGEGLAALDEVLDVPGIDGVLIGAADLSIALSQGLYVDQNADIVDRELDRIVAACRDRGKYAMIACRDVETAKAMSLRGFHVCSMGNDYFLLDLVTRQMLSIARSVAG